MPRTPSPIVGALRRLQTRLYTGGWVVGLARALGLSVREVATTRVDVAISAGRTGVRPLRIGYASDFHAGPTTDPDVLHSAVSTLLAAEPDIVLLGGDFVNFRPTEVDALAAELRRLAAQRPCFAVLGNHDWLADPRYIVRRLEEQGIEVLTNRNLRLDPPFEQVWICGLDDHWYGRPHADLTFEGADGVRIVLMHAPSGLLDIGDHRFDLALCGHTHGGQIALPGGRPVVLPNGALSRQYPRGRYDLADGGTLIVSTGVGCALLPLRIHADAEVVICTVTFRP